MVQQVLTPGVQNGDKANLGAQVFGVGCDSSQSLSSGLKQNVVDHILVLECDRANLLRHGKHHMEILYRQQLGLTLRQPLGTRQRLTLGAMTISAAVIGDALVAAGIAFFNVTTQCHCSALLDGTHDAKLPQAQ
jgi:hypothetical protein